MNEIRLCNRNQRDKQSRWHDTDTDNGEVITIDEKLDQAVRDTNGYNLFLRGNYLVTPLTSMLVARSFHHQFIVIITEQGVL